MSRRKNILLKCGIAAAIGAGMVWLTLSLHGFSELTDSAARIRLLADAFTIPGVIMVMVGFLVMVANGGFFNGVSYVASYAVKMLIPGANKNHERYGDYVVRKREKGKVTGYGFIFVVGLVFVLVAVIFTVLFYTV